MLKHIIKHETRLLRQEKTAWIIFIAFIALAIMAAFNGKSWVKSATELQQKAFAESKKEYEKYPQEFADHASGKIVPNNGDSGEPYVRDIADSYEIGFYAKVAEAIPVAPLWNLANGQADLFPSYYEINTRPRNELITFTKTGEFQNPLMMLVGNFDLSFLFVYLYPLLIIALCFNLLSAERENGTLRMLLSQPLPLRRLIVGKLIPRMILLLGLGLILPFAAYFVSNFGSPNPHFTTAEIIFRLTGWALIIAVYGLFWFFVCVLIASRGKSSAFNAIATTAVWLFLAVLLPSIISLTADFLYPTPSRATLTQEIRRIEREINDKQNHLKFQEKFFAELNTKPTERVLEKRQDVLNDYAGRGEINRQINRMENDLRDLTDRQQNFVRRVSLVSPPLLVQHLLNDFAGTNAERFQHFSRSIGEFHQNFFAYFATKFLKDERIKFADIENFPKFGWQEKSLREILTNRFVEIFGLVFITFIVGYISFNRLKTDFV